jgi:leucyl/phenylalanyl-tRNA--protein transferase
MIPWLEAESPFPDAATALTDRDGAAGLLAAGADLAPQRLLMAYKQGIFRGFLKASPYYGGPPTRAWCCKRRTSKFQTV